MAQTGTTQGNVYLGLDLGGTSTKVGLVLEDGTLLAHTTVPTTDLSGEGDCAAYVDAIARFVAGARPDAAQFAAAIPLRAIGFALPSIVAGGVPRATTNVNLSWPQLEAALSARFPQVECVCVNDANAAALGEAWRGSALDARVALFVTLGAGVGAGIVVGGKLVKGNGGAGEIGHLIVEPEGRLCGCGRRGCAEMYASARGIMASYREAEARGVVPTSTFHPKDLLDAQAVFEAAREGDACAQYAVTELADKLGRALSQVTCVIDADVIVLGGGVSRSADVFLNKLAAAYRAYAFAPAAEVVFRTATLGNDAGMIGAVRNAQLTIADRGRA